MSERAALMERLRRQTGEAQRRYAAVEAELTGRRREPPQPGDLFLLAETAELPVEWAVIDRDPQPPGRLLAVPADSGSLVGSGDVAAPAASRGPLTLRCRFATWLEAAAFDPAMRTGSLAPEAVAAARRRWRTLEAGRPAGSALERQVDAEAEYRDWSEEVPEKARAAVAGRSREPGERPGKVLAFRRPSLRASTWAIAASFFLLTTLGLGVRVWRAERQIEDLRAAGERPLINLPFAVLAAVELRGEATTLRLPAAASHVMLILQLDDPEPYPSYRLEIRHQASGRQAWASSALAPTGLAELSVALPRDLLGAGEYRLHLAGLGQGRPQQLGEYALRIESE